MTLFIEVILSVRRGLVSTGAKVASHGMVMVGGAGFMAREGDHGGHHVGVWRRVRWTIQGVRRRRIGVQRRWRWWTIGWVIPMHLKQG